MPDQELDNVGAEVIRVIAQTQRIPAQSISLNSTFDELKIDSLDAINIVFGLENAFGINIPDEGLRTMKSVRDAAVGVDRLLSEKSASVQPGEP